METTKPKGGSGGSLELQSAFGNVTKKHVDDEDEIKTGRHGRKSKKPRHRQPLSDAINVTEDETKLQAIKGESEKMILMASTNIILGEPTKSLPASLSRLQRLSRLASQDGKFAKVWHDHIDNVIQDILLQKVEESILAAKGTEVEEFLTVYDVCFQRVWHLHTTFQLLDNSPVYERQVAPQCMAKIGAAVLASNKPPSEQQLFDLHSEDSRMRNRILMRLCDILETYLSTDEEVSAFTVFGRFFEVISEIERYTLKENTILRPVLERCLSNPAVKLRERWAQLSPHEYIRRCMQMDKHLNDLSSVYEQFFENGPNMKNTVMTLMLNSGGTGGQMLSAVFANPMEHIEDLSYVHNLYKEQKWPIDALVTIFSKSTEHAFEQVIKGLPKLSNMSGTKVFGNILKLQREINHVIGACFESDILFKLAATHTAEEAMKNADRSSSHKFIDTLLKHITLVMRGNPSNTKIMETIEPAIEILSMMPNERRYFFEQYPSYVSKRLLKGDSNAVEREKWLLQELQATFGETKVGDTRTMLYDFGESAKLLDKFNLNHHPPFDARFFCVKEDEWGNVPDNLPVNIPDEMLQVATEFEKDFKAEKKGTASMKWQLYLHRVELDVDFGNTVQSIDASIYHTAIILAFETDHLSLDKLLSITGMQKPFLLKNLDTLINEYSIISSSDGTYSLNHSFVPVKGMLHVKPTRYSVQKAHKDERRTGKERDGFEMLGMRTRSFIMRTLKQEKFLSHDTLYTRILDYFSAEHVDVDSILQESEKDVRMLIKESIEHLLLEGFIARNDDGYSYVP